jgi:hypothetical protein
MTEELEENKLDQKNIKKEINQNQVERRKNKSFIMLQNRKKSK